MGARDANGRIACEIGAQGTEQLSFFAPHDIWLDSQGSLYVSEVVRSAAKGKKPQGRDYHTLQKFIKR